MSWPTEEYYKNVRFNIRKHTDKNYHINTIKINHFVYAKREYYIIQQLLLIETKLPNKIEIQCLVIRVG